MEARVGIEPSSPLQIRKLFISRSDKNYKNVGNAEVRYTAGTWSSNGLRQNALLVGWNPVAKAGRAHGRFGDTGVKFGPISFHWVGTIGLDRPRLTGNQN